MDIAKKDLGGNSQIVLYQPNETISIEVKLDVEYDTVWLSIDQMAQLFGRDKSVIGKHISENREQELRIALEKHLKQPKNKENVIILNDFLQKVLLYQK